MKFNILSILALTSLSLGFNAQAQNKVFVNATATGANDGSSWSNAFTSLHSALSVADTNLTIDSVLVAGGTYFPEQPLPGYTSSFMNSFYIKRSGLSVLGGYDAANGTRNVMLNPTVLSAEVGDTALISDNYYSIMTIAGKQSDTLSNLVLDGLTFTKGNNLNYGLELDSMQSAREQMGGALFVRLAELSINDCVFSHNNSGWTGGAIGAEMSDLSVSNSIFSNNSAEYGGSIFLILAGNLNVTNTKFENERVYRYGSAIVLEEHFEGNVTIDNSKFIDCIGSAAIIIWSKLNTTISNSIFDHNQGEVLVLDTWGSQAESLVFKGNIVNDNDANFRSIFELNSSYLDLEFSNNLILNNRTTASGFLLNMATDKFSNNTIVNNNFGYLFSWTYANHDIHNTIVYENTLGALFTGNSVEFNNSYIQGSSDTTNGNIDATIFEPGFVNYDTVYANANFNLAFCSPLINAGDKIGLDSALLTTDINGNPRVVGANIDIGAYEKQSDVIVGDYIKNAALTNASSNNVALMPTCDDADWTYYTTNSNSDSIVFAIKWGANNAAAKANAQVYVTEDAGFTLVESGDDAMATLGRFWNVDLGADTLVENVMVRFFYSAADSTAVADALTALGRNNITTKWFMTDTAFDPATQVSATAINNGNIETYTVANGSINGLRYVELSGVSGLVGGTMMFASDKANSIKNNVLAQVKIAPNPATTQITLQNINAAYLNKPATIVDVYGRVLHNIQLKENMVIDVQSYTPGMYFINVEGSGAARFIKK